MHGELKSIALGFAYIFICWAAGSALVAQFNLPIPGAVLGLLLLFGSFSIFPRIYDAVNPTGNWLLRNFPLFLYPLGAGFLTLSGLSIGGFIRIIITILISLLISLTLCAYLFRRMKHNDN